MVVIRIAEKPQPDGTKPQEEPKGREFDRNKFLDKMTTDVNVARKGMLYPPEGRQQPGMKAERVKFSPELLEQYKRFLSDYIVKLASLRDPQNPTSDLFSQILNDPAHAIEKDLFNHLATQKKDAAGNPTKYMDADKTKIDEYLKSEEGWITTTQLIETMTAYQLFALGLHLEAKPKEGMSGGVRDPLATARLVRTGEDAGIIRDIREDIWNRLPGTPAQKGAMARLSGVSSAIGTVVGGFPGGSLIGAGAPAAVYGGYRTVQWLNREGLVLDFKQCSGTFRAINNNPAEREYVKRVLGIHMDDYQEVGANIINVNPDKNTKTERRADELLREVLEKVYTRQQFYVSLGVPLENLDALPEQHLYATTPYLKQEQTGARWQSEVQEEFDPQTNILDTYGRAKDDPLFMSATPPAGWAGPLLPAGLDYEGNIRRYMEARRRVWTRHITRFLTEKMELKNDVNIAKILKERKSKLGTEGRNRITATWTKQKETLTKDQDILTPEKDAVDTYRTALDALQQARETVSAELAGITVGGHAFDSIEELIKNLKTLNQTGVSADIGGRGLNSFYDTNLQIVTDKTTAYGLITYPRGTPEYKDERTRIDAEFQDRVDALQADRDFVTQTITRLEGLAADQKAKLEAFAETKDLAKSIKKIDSFSKDMEIITGYAAPAAAGIASLTELELRTLDFDQIIDRINQINTATGGVTSRIGWPKEQNTRQDLRTKVYHAIFEAQARHAAPPAFAVTLGGTTPFEILTNTDYNMTENQIRTLSDKDIAGFVARRTPGIVFSAVDAQNARNVAEQRFEARTKALSDRADLTTEGIANLGQRIDSADIKEFENDLGARMKLLENYVNKDFGEEFLAKKAEFTDTSLIMTDNTYVEVEKNLNAPKGYYEIMNLLFSYKSEDSRSGFFEIVQKILPPDRLAELLDSSLHLLPIGPGLPAPTMATVLPAIAARPGLTGYEIQRAIQSIVRQLGEEGLAVAA